MESNGQAVVELHKHLESPEIDDELPKCSIDDELPKCSKVSGVPAVMFVGKVMNTSAFYPLNQPNI